MTSKIMENDDIKNYLIYRVKEKNIVNMINEFALENVGFVVGRQYPVFNGGDKPTNHNDIIILKKTKKTITFKLADKECVMITHGNRTERCDNPDAQCAHCKLRANNEPKRKKIYSKNDIEYISPDIYNLKKWFYCYADKYV